MFFNNNELYGAYGLWHIVIYYIMMQNNDISDSIKDYIDDNTKEFISNTPDNLKISMGFNGHHPNYKTNIDVALYYSVLSTYLYCKYNTERDIMKDIVNAFPAIEKILDLVNIDVSEYNKRIHIIKIATKLLKTIKTVSSDIVFKTIISKVVKNIKYNDHIFLLDAVISTSDWVTKVEYTLFKKNLVNQNMKIEDLSLEFNLELLDPIIDLDIGNNYSVCENSLNNKSIAMSCRTMRPLSILNNKSWIKYSENTWGPLSNQVSMNKLILDFYIIYKYFPNPNSLSDMINYMFIVEKRSKKNFILPDNIDFSYKDIARSFQDTYIERTVLYPDLCTYDLICKDIKMGISIKNRQILEK